MLGSELLTYNQGSYDPFLQMWQTELREEVVVPLSPTFQLLPLSIVSYFKLKK